MCPRDAIELEAPEAFDGDSRLGVTLAEQFRIETFIAEGGMARVYEARHVRLPRRVFAVKILLGTMVREPEIVARFHREAEIASGIDHPNVVQVHDVGTMDDGTPYIVSERLHGEDLAHRLAREGRIGVEATVAILRQLCAALTVVHERGIVHRDLKPDNLFLVGDPARPTVKLIDFGIAKLSNPGGAHTQTGVILGTPAFMAPEQARGEAVDTRADIYAAGAIAYRCLTGRPPFDVEDSAAALHALLTSHPPRPRTLAPDLSEALELVLQRAMASDPHERYPTPAALDAALAPFVGTPVPIAPADASTEQLVASARLARPTIAAALAMGMVFVASGVADALAAVFIEPDAMAVGGPLAVFGAFAGLATPTWLYVRHLREQVWDDSPRAVELAQRAVVCVGAGVGAYGLLLMLGRVLDLLLGGAVGPSAALRTSVWVCALALALAAEARVRRGSIPFIRG